MKPVREARFEEEGDQVVCPCGSEWTHVYSAFTRRGTDEREARIYPGTVENGTTQSRRSALVVQFSCECCGGMFEWVIQQHKGINYFTVGRRTMTGLERDIAVKSGY